MPLLTLKQAATELGYRSIESIHNLARRGVLRIVKIPGASKNANRVNSEDIDRIKRGDVAPTGDRSSSKRSRPIVARNAVRLPKPPKVVRRYA